MPAADPIAQLLEGSYVDPETGASLACESRAVAIDDSLDGGELQLVESLGLAGRRVVVIDDVDTHAALGARVERALASKLSVQTITLPHAPHADVETIAALVAQVDPLIDGVITVGSGTLNDLSKMVAMQLDRPHAVFATAPSMNGYTSVSASITEAGFKRSVRARTPAGVFMDLRVLADAPTRLIRAGLGDSVCRATAQTDWRLSHELLGTPYRTVPFALLVEDEATLFASASSLVTGDLRAIRALARTLILSGFGMTLVGGSYPASQGEHLISHWLEMRRASDFLHGEQTGVAAIAMARLQVDALSRETIAIDPPPIDRDALIARYGPAIGETCAGELAKKQLTNLSIDWTAIRARLGLIAISPQMIAAVLCAAGAPTTPAEIGISDELFADALAHAHEIRDRYTFLDFTIAINRTTSVSAG